MRARFVDEKPWAQIAAQFKLNEGTLRNQGQQLRKSLTIRQLDDRKAKAKRNARIIALRQNERLSNAEIAERLKAENLKAGTTTIGLVLRHNYVYHDAISARITGFTGQKIRRIARRDRVDCPLQRAR